MRYGSVCSGIEAATQAWHPLGWRPSFFSEIEKFPRAVLQHHYPDVPLHGDFTTIEAGQYDPIDLLVGGTPCQSFSIAGLRGGLGDDRGNLALEYLRLADRLRPRWLVWENVPGVLSSNEGRDFGAILGGMVELGYGFAYRVLDAQFCRTHRFAGAVPQRRRRVFVVGHSMGWRRPAAVLFDRESMSGHSAPRREAGQGFAADVAPSLVSSGRGVERAGETRGQDPLIAETICAPVASTLNAAFGSKMGLEDQHVNSGCPLFVATVSGNEVSHALSAEGADASEDGTGRGTPIIAFNSREDPEVTGDRAGPLTCGTPQAQAIAFDMRVRRLMPVECERLQGFPDGFTNIPWRGKDHAPDGQRYRALGNSMAANVMEWIGRRIALVDGIAGE